MGSTLEATNNFAVYVPSQESGNQEDLKKRSKSPSVSTQVQIAKDGFILQAGLAHPELQRTVSRNKGIQHCFYLPSTLLKSFVIGNVLKDQNWGHYLESKFELHKKFIIWFYRYACIENYTDIHGTVHMKVKIDCGDTIFTYGCYDFCMDFGGISCSEFPRCATRKWPHDLPTVVEMNEDILKHPSGVKVDDNICDIQRLRPNDVILVQIIRMCLLQTTSTEPTLNHEELSLLYLLTRGDQLCLSHIIFNQLSMVMWDNNVDHLPFGGFITHIMRKWHILANTRRSGVFVDRMDRMALQDSPYGKLKTGVAHFLWDK